MSNDDTIALMADDVLIKQTLDTCDPAFRDEVAYVLRLARSSEKLLSLADVDSRKRTKLIYEETIRAYMPPMIVEKGLERSVVLNRLKQSLLVYPQ
jgi:hypothetical protein